MAFIDGIDGLVAIAFHGKQALEMLKSAPHPDLIISDVMMPVMDGYQLLRALKLDSKTKDIAVLLMSAAMPNYAEVPKQDIAFFLPKPFDLDRLLEAIQSLLAT